MCFFKAKTSFDFACFCCLLCLESPVMVSLTPMPSGGGCRPQGRPERENVTGPQCGNDRSGGKYANDCTVCKRSGSPSSVIRLAGDRRMPPSPAGGRKWETRSGLVGRADPGAPRSYPPVLRNFGRIRKRLPVGKGLAPSGRECPDVRRPWANPQACSAFARAFPCRTVYCAERASPFPTM